MVVFYTRGSCNTTKEDSSPLEKLFYKASTYSCIDITFNMNRIYLRKKTGMQLIK